jgi:hypothetical protein
MQNALQEKSCIIEMLNRESHFEIPLQRVGCSSSLERIQNHTPIDANQLVTKWYSEVFPRVR